MDSCLMKNMFIVRTLLLAYIAVNYAKDNISEWTEQIDRCWCRSSEEDDYFSDDTHIGGNLTLNAYANIVLKARFSFSEPSCIFPCHK